MSANIIITQALLSVSDKTNLESLAITLQKKSINMLARGGTAELLADHNIKHTRVSEYTQQPEILSGRVKTLHPKIFGGILARDDHAEDIEQLNYQSKSSKVFPKRLYLNVTKSTDLRYGGNPDQQAAVYTWTNHKNLNSTLTTPRLLQGKALSYNNILDSLCAINVIKSLIATSQFNNLALCTIIKHATPCGVAGSNQNITDAYHRAFHADSRSVYDGSKQDQSVIKKANELNIAMVFTNKRKFCH